MCALEMELSLNHRSSGTVPMIIVIRTMMVRLIKTLKLSTLVDVRCKINYLMDSIKISVGTLLSTVNGNDVGIFFFFDSTFNDVKCHQPRIV